MADINMDIRKNTDAQMPVFEFTLPKSEVDLDVKVGERGELILPVEVIAVQGSRITFRKNGEVKTDRMFQQEPLDQMRDRIGIVEDTEESMVSESDKDK